MLEFERARRASRHEMSRRRFMLITTGSVSMLMAALSNAPNAKSPFRVLEKAGFVVGPDNYANSYIDEVKRRVIPRFAYDLGQLAGKELEIVPPTEEMEELAVMLSTLPPSVTLKQMGKVAARRALFVAYGLGINAYSFQDKPYDSFTPLQDSLLSEHFLEIVDIAKGSTTSAVSVAPILDDLGNRFAVIELSSIPNAANGTDIASGADISTLTFPPGRSLLELE